MKRCKRVKNPCKICLQAVTNKTGVQCKGACKRWAHFTCLGYTNGKIHDIKAGIITITCPCPTCNSLEPEEFSPLYNNNGCPEDSLPKCENTTCPNNNPAPIPDYTRNVSETTRLPCGPTSNASHVIEQKHPFECKQAPKSGNPHVFLKYPGRNALKSAEAKCYHPPIEPQTTQISSKSHKSNSDITNECCKSKDECTKRQELDKKITCRSHNNENFDYNDYNREIIKKRNKGCNVEAKISTETVINRDLKGTATGRDSVCKANKINSRVKTTETKVSGECCCTTECCSSSSEDQENCCTCGKTCISSPGKTLSCSSFSTISDCLQGIRRKKAVNSHECKSASDSALSLPCDSHKALLCTIHQLCSNVGHLSKQIKELMCKMLVGNDSGL